MRLSLVNILSFFIVTKNIYFWLFGFLVKISSHYASDESALHYIMHLSLRNILVLFIETTNIYFWIFLFLVKISSHYASEDGSSHYAF